MYKVFARKVSFSKIGLGHVKSKTVCQDAVADRKNGSTIAVCLCDGAGSLPLSHIGASITAEASLNHIINDFSNMWNEPTKAGESILEIVIPKLEIQANLRKISVKDLSCTLVFVAARLSGNSVSFICGNIGDGVVISRNLNKLNVVLNPENGEYANQTWFVTSDDAKERLRVLSGEISADKLPGWILSTDGAAEFLFNKNTGKFAPANLALLEDLRTENENRARKTAMSFIDNYVLHKTNDDCSLGLIQFDCRSKKFTRRKMH